MRIRRLHYKWNSLERWFVDRENEERERDRESDKERHRERERKREREGERERERRLSTREREIQLRGLWNLVISATKRAVHLFECRRQQ